MSELDYIGADELVFNNDIKEGIHSGGFNVKSIMMRAGMMRAGMSPIMTVNRDQLGGGEKVSDLFDDLVIPNWTLSYNNRITGGKHKEIQHEDSDEEDDVVDDDLHEKLLDLVKEHNIEMKKSKKKTTRRMKNKKTGTKRRKLN